MMQSSAVSWQNIKAPVLIEKVINIIPHSSKSPARGWRRWETGLADLMLLLVLPLMLLIAFLIRIDSPGAAFFIQRRLGLNGREFVCFKFRTMYREPTGLLAEHLQDNPARGVEWHDYAKLRDDPRITRMGRLLRRLSLDELPQLINVLKGDMSFIGPRPYLITEKERLGQYGEAIMAVRPGLTGLWQVSGRNE